jgi:stage II sporulation protein E
VTHIPGGTLPAGSFANGDTQSFSINCEKGSMVVLVSDGIISSENSRAHWIEEMIGKYDGCEPRELAQKILSRAKELSGEEIADDLTVVAAYIG